MTDRTTKLLLTAIALGLWVNVAAVLRPTPAHADADDFRGLIHDVHALYNGTCTNDKLC